MYIHSHFSQELDRDDLMENCGVKGNIDGVRKMIEKFGAEVVVNARNRFGPCLHFAAFFNHSDIIDLLVENGADVDQELDNGDPPLRFAINNRSYSAITTLINLGASLEKAKAGIADANYFNESMKEEKTIEAIEKGKRLAGEKKINRKNYNMYSRYRLDLEIWGNSY